MNTNPKTKSTSEIQMIATGVVGSQVKVCDAKRENTEDKIAANAAAVGANAAAIAENNVQIAALTTKVAVLKGHPGMWAAIGAGTPTLLAVLLWWFSK